MLLPILTTLAWATPQAVVEARVTPDGERLTGTLRLIGLEDPNLVDPLQLLPDPQDDSTLFRTFPGQPDTGSVEWTEVAPDLWAFEANLPRRYGALGTLPGRGLWANGGWYPQVLGTEEALPLLSWEATVELPPGWTGALNGTSGTGTLHWEGEADRLSLAALANGRISILEGPSGTLTLVEDGVSRRGRNKHLQEVYAALAEEGITDLVVVEAPMYRRLVRPGPGLLFLSDNAFRLKGHMKAFHRLPAARGLLGAGLPVVDPWERALASEAAAQAYAQDRRFMEATEVLRFARFVPSIDTVLYDGRTPYHAEVFNEVFPADPLTDDLLEMIEGCTPGSVAAIWLDDLGGAGTSRSVGQALVSGQSLAEALEKVDPTLAQVTGWRAPYADQDLTLTVEPDGDGWRATITRDAPPDAPPIPIQFQVGDQLDTWVTGSGTDETQHPLERPERISIDPERHVLQTDPLPDRWPARRRSFLLVSQVETFVPTQQTVIGSVIGTVRREYDTRSVFQAMASVTEDSLLGLKLRYSLGLGELLDRRTRTHILSAWGGAALLDPRYRPTAGLAIAAEGGLSWSWDTRVSSLFPLQGHTTRLTVTGGLVPGTSERWGSALGTASGTWAPHTRLVFAGRVSGGVAEGDVAHRLLSLGGVEDVRGVAAGSVVGRRKFTGTIEVRTEPVRNVSIWMPMAWATRFQAAVSLEGGVVDQVFLEEAPLDRTGRQVVLGGALSLSMISDGFGARPGMAHVTLARPLMQWPVYDAKAPLQVLLRGEVPF